MITYEAKIFIGLRENYDGKIHTYDEVLQICKNYCDAVGLGVTIFLGMCVYKEGHEPVVQIGMINYPRFPSFSQQIFEHATKLGKLLASAFNQQRFTIVATDKTEMIEAPY